MTITPFDFRKPGPVACGLEPLVAGWWRRACALATSNWASALPFALQIHYESADSVPAADALAQLGDSAVGYPLMVQQSITTVMSWPRPLALSIVQGLLGDASDQLPIDRELTLIEDALFEFYLKDLLAQNWMETWRGTSPCQLLLSSKETNPRWGKWYAPNEALIVATFRLTGALGEQRWQWLMPAKAMVELLNPSPAPARDDSSTLPKRLEELVQSLPMDLTVVVGSAELMLSQLAKLAPGDVIVLNQRVTHPLGAWLGGKKIMSGWPGRVGTRQAFQIKAIDDKPERETPPGADD